MSDVSWLITTGPAYTAPEKSAIAQAREALIVSSASGKYLARAGENYAVQKPPFLTSDELYQKIVQVLAFKSTDRLSVIYKLLEVILGTQAELISQGLRPWRVYSMILEVIVELPMEIVATSEESASYLHGFYGRTYGTCTTTSVVIEGDVTASGDVVGAALAAFITSWEERTILTATYDATTGRSTVTTAAFSQAPSNGKAVYIATPGDGVTGYRGDYLATKGFSGLYSGNANIVTIQGNVSHDLMFGSVLRLFYDGAFHEHSVDVSYGYFGVNNYTEVEIIPDLPSPQVNQPVVVEQELADQTDTPEHDVRIYLQEDGLFDIAEFYLTNYMIASGVKLTINRV